MVLCILSLLMVKRAALDGAYVWLMFSKRAPMVTLGIGGMWFLWNVLHMSTADFGEYRGIFFLAFLSIILLSFYGMRELLAVRGLSVLLLVCSDMMLDSVYCEEIFLKNFFVAFVYGIIIFAMMIGSMPHLLRDMLQRLLLSRLLRTFCGILALACGLLLIFMALFSAQMKPPISLSAL